MGLSLFCEELFGRRVEIETPNSLSLYIGLRVLHGPDRARVGAGPSVCILYGSLVRGEASLKVYFPLMNSFEYDADKSSANLEKHGIDFHTAQELWNDPAGVEIQANSETEPRFIFLGRIGSRHWSAVFTYRGKNIRLISVRCARAREIELYES
uniref:Uncharacterized conserved protein, DUF497 family n=1 Tax=Candidatus Kentrum sp. TUN TaxID=2126343 RepID=A0A451A5T6_9GAMM|nr:MAG: Uncharacterized conserved protein, DUF497 family [Candidatus Kentron sp. TUN]VFK70341.1 MAG: Uncharacterized conserved protein, DUF497 family [Candidatus Kentron sp. TUN]